MIPPWAHVVLLIVQLVVTSVTMWVLRGIRRDAKSIAAHRQKIMRSAAQVRAANLAIMGELTRLRATTDRTVAWLHIRKGQANGSQ